MWFAPLNSTSSPSVINECMDLGMNYLVSLVALFGMCGRARGGCCWINSHKESGSRLLSRSTAKGPSHQKLMSYLDHAVSSALDWESAAGPGSKEPPPPPPDACVRLCLYASCVSYRSAERDWQLKKNKAVERVIMPVQLFSLCLVQMLDSGCKPSFMAGNVKTKLLSDSIVTRRSGTAAAAALFWF